MRAVIKLELIADDYFWHTKHNLWEWDRQFAYIRRLGVDKSPSWIAKIYPGWKREYIRGIRDYSTANATGSRGIFEYFPLTEGVYEVNNRYKLNKVRRYYIIVIGETISEINRTEAEKWLEQNTKNISE